MNVKPNSRSAYRRKTRSDKGKSRTVNDKDYLSFTAAFTAKGLKSPITREEFHELLKLPCGLCGRQSTKIKDFKGQLERYCTVCAQFYVSGDTQEQLIKWAGDVSKYQQSLKNRL